LTHDFVAPLLPNVDQASHAELPLGSQNITQAAPDPTPVFAGEFADTQYLSAGNELEETAALYTILQTAITRIANRPSEERLYFLFEHLPVADVETLFFMHRTNICNNEPFQLMDLTSTPNTNAPNIPEEPFPRFSDDLPSIHETNYTLFANASTQPSSPELRGSHFSRDNSTHTASSGTDLDELSGTGATVINEPTSTIDFPSLARLLNRTPSPDTHPEHSCELPTPGNDPTQLQSPQRSQYDSFTANPHMPHVLAQDTCIPVCAEKLARCKQPTFLVPEPEFGDDLVNWDSY
jgi:hypothetical protein